MPMAIDNNGNLWRWGDEIRSSMGLPSKDVGSIKPEKIMDNVKHISVGGDNLNAVVKENGDLYIWGVIYPIDFDLDDPVKAVSYEPVKIMSNVAYVSVGSMRGAGISAIKDNGELWTWGNIYSNNELVIEPATNTYKPVKVMDNISHVSTGAYATIAVNNNGEAFVWGSNFASSLNKDISGDLLSPNKIMDNIKIAYVSDEISSFAAVTNDNQLITWGINNYDQLGYKSEKSVGYGPIEHTPKKILDGIIVGEPVLISQCIADMHEYI